MARTSGRHPAPTLRLKRATRPFDHQRRGWLTGAGLYVADAVTKRAISDGFFYVGAAAVAILRQSPKPALAPTNTILTPAACTITLTCTASLVSVGLTQGVGSDNRRRSLAFGRSITSTTLGRRSTGLTG
jgi:hypothetical protein